VECLSTTPSEIIWDAFAERYPVGTLVVRNNGHFPKLRKLNYFAAAGNGVSFGAHNNDLDTLLRGLLERVYLHKEGNEWVTPHVPVAEFFRRRLEPFTRAYQKVARGLTPLSNEEFVASCDGRKRVIYEKARVELEAFGLLKQDVKLKTFVKFEKLNLTKKPDPAPRVIQPRSPKYNVAIGVYLRPLEGVLYKNIKKVFGGITVFKGMNAVRQGWVAQNKWGRFSDPVAVGIDAKRFDQHVHRHALEYEHMIYNLHYNDRVFAQLLRHQLRQKGSARCFDGTVSYKIDGRRASGDMNTGCGNCLLMCAMVYSYMTTVGLVLPDGTCNFEFLNNGDDGVVVLERTHLHLLDGMGRWFEQMGFPIEVEEPVYQLEHVEFCQTHPVFDGSDWVMMRDPRICLTKDLCTTKPLRSVGDWNTLRNSVSLCGLSLAGNMPVFCEFYRFLGRGAGKKVDRDLTQSGFTMLAHGLQQHLKPVTDSCRLSFASAFGILPSEQLAWERHYKSLVPTFCVPLQVPFPPEHPNAMGSVC
jgi:hypothetical protein